jgi:hypothetical protein
VKANTTDAGSLPEAALGADAVAHAALMHDEGTEEAECTVVGAVLDVLWDTGRTSAYNSGLWVKRDTSEGVDLAEAASRAGDADGKVEA